MEGVPLSLPYSPGGNKSSWHLYVVNFDDPSKELKDIRNIIYKDLVKNGYGVNVHYIPIHLHPFYRKLGFNIGDFPNSERYYKTALSLPIFPNQRKKIKKKL